MGLGRGSVEGEGLLGVIIRGLEVEGFECRKGHVEEIHGF